MYELYDYICVNMEDIFTLVLSFTGNGGLTEGIYELVDNKWKKKD